MTPKPAAKKTIAIDVDDVLSVSAAGFIKFSNQQFGTNLTLDDYDEHWARMWKVDHAEEVRRSHTVHGQDVFLKFDAITEARPVQETLAEKYKLVVATSRIRALEKGTQEWISRNFGDVISEYHSAGIWDDFEKDSHEKVKVTKADIVRQIGADYLIDDQPKHCFAAAGAGIKAVLFGDYSWNRDVSLPPRVTRARSWQAVLEYFDAEA
jgi:5'(3')-deoxyribonucleotidase